jgi:hypothetical protein
VIHVWVRSDVDWDDEAAFIAQCPPAFRPKVETWNATLTMPYHVYRGRVRAIARDNLAAVHGATCADWDAIPDGAVVLPVDDDDWFAPNTADVLARLWDGSGGGCSWTSTYLEVPLQRRHGLEMAARRVLPQIPPRFICTTNNYALVKAADTRSLAARHIQASAWMRRSDAPRLDVRLSVMNRTLGSQTSLGHPRGVITRKALVRKLGRYRRLYRRPPRLPDWCAPYVERMAELMEEVEAR